MNRLQVYSTEHKSHYCRCGKALIQLGWLYICPERRWWNFWHAKTTKGELEGIKSRRGWLS